jgi:hypothetical protein
MNCGLKAIMSERKREIRGTIILIESERKKKEKKI